MFTALASAFIVVRHDEQTWLMRNIYPGHKAVDLERVVEFICA